MNKILIATAVLLLAATANADARVKHKRHHVAHVPPAVEYLPADPVFRGRPAWAQPGQCLEDQGYGRYIPCGSAPSLH
jgi:hypothetical protein